eukprot:5021338-Prymnesium_polylepis.1
MGTAGRCGGRGTLRGERVEAPQPCGGGAHHDSFSPRTVHPGLTRVNDRGGSNTCSNFHARARARRCAWLATCASGGAVLA